VNKEQYFQFHQTCVEKMTAITKAKNADYTGIGSDPFANFTRVEALGICSTEQGFLTRMMDKFCRLNSFAQKGVLEVKDESVEDTLLDLANYAILMAGYIRSKRESAAKLKDRLPPSPFQPPSVMEKLIEEHERNRLLAAKAAREEASLAKNNWVAK
jgi:hypothetical protein